MVPFTWDLPQPDGLVLIRVCLGAAVVMLSQQLCVLQTHSLEVVTKMCSNSRSFLNCFKKKRRRRHTQ